MSVQSNPMDLFDEAKSLHNKGVDGDKKAVIQANEMLSKLREALPDHAPIEAYYGSTLVLLGRDAVKILDKVDKVEEGLAALNRAVSLDSEHKEIRWLRGNICLRLPESFFQCSATAIEDFTFLLDRCRHDSGYLTDAQVREVRQYLGMAYRNAGQPEQAEAVMQRRLNGKQT